MHLKIWQRYLIREIGGFFFLFLGCFYFFYALIDYSLHMQNFMQDTRVTFSHIFLYYLFEFIKRADLLIPLAVLITTIKVLFALNIKGELVALRASGLSLKVILRPFFYLAIALALFNYMSNEWILPSSLTFIDRFQEQHWKPSSKDSHLYTLSLSDQSKLIYQAKDPQKQLLTDVFWIRNADEIWRMKFLYYDLKQPTGFFVDQLKRNNKGHFEKMESFEKYSFILFKGLLENHKTPLSLENQKISTLFKNLLKKRLSPYEYPIALSYFLLKITMPLLSLLVVLAIAPFCISHSRSFPVFLTYALALFGFIAFFTLLDATIILSKNETISAFYAILMPFCICFSLFSYRYFKRVQ
ncbi:LptF/LptG family permease [Candidatus Rhabdochlamydia porcellionis]|jgi:lipopolysaccharide export system permease protein|uniref:Lipopolysaccharide export system permease LptF/LptG n=1 Tax=Candidatus Rhabdochlamydia porcellionis TaxID=225148 RepID=A0ABX8YZZ5_9BACT|nr:LptF/LptG family permease [Candidatus Rhabdochlamydia porcellionis]QZA58986.1 Lipopolysaccharide export system permease LptF/LptG [Candidatus Rhabdochlamydia porcellionis]